MTSKDVKKEILDGIFRSKDGLSSNELTELINTIIVVSKKEAIAENDKCNCPKCGCNKYAIVENEYWCLNKNCGHEWSKEGGEG